MRGNPLILPLQPGASPDTGDEAGSTSRSRKRPPVLIAAPGGGLGHLVRAWAVSMQLAKLGVASKVVTHSRYAQGFSRLTGCPVDFIPASRWKQAIPAYCEDTKPDLVVLDTFPWGVRGEWAHPRSRHRRFALLARRLNVPAYLGAAGLEWDAKSPVLRQVIACEPLSPAYRERLEASATHLNALPGRIRPLVDELPWKVPPRLEERLQQQTTWLVVHSGPVDEVGRLMHLARNDMESHGTGQIMAIVPEETSYPGASTLQFFPASLLYPLVHRVVTAAGYNCIAETASWSAKHLCLPCSRRYDEQEERLREVRMDPGVELENGVFQAARSIASLL